MAERRGTSSRSGSRGGSSRGGNRSGSRSRGGNRGGSNSGGFPRWGLYAIGGLAIAGIIYGLSKYGPTSETISGWVESATGFMGADDDTDEYADDDFDEEEEGTANATGGSSYGAQ